MTKESDNSENRSLSDAEIRKLESETAKNEAERKKLTLEAEEADKRLRQKWYSKRIIVQALVGGVIASALVAAWMISYLQPLLRADLERLQLENTIEMHRNELKSQDNERRTKALEQENESNRNELESIAAQNEVLQAEQAELRRRAEALQARMEKFSRDYGTLAAKQELTAAERNRFSRLAREAQKEVQQQKDEVKNLRAAQVETKNRSNRITQQLSTRAIRGISVQIIHTHQRRPDALKIETKLSLAGADVNLRIVHSGLATKIPMLYYLSDSRLEAAEQIKKLIADIVFVVVAKTALGKPHEISLWVV